MCLRLSFKGGHHWRERYSEGHAADGAGAIFLHDNKTVCKTVRCHQGDMIQVSRVHAWLELVANRLLLQLMHEE